MSSVVKTLGTSASARLLTLPVTAIATVVTTFLLVKEIGVESYAYVVLVGSLFQLVPFADLGLGAAVVSATAKRMQSRQEAAMALATANAAFKTLLTSATVLAALAVAIGLCEFWPSLLGLPANLSPSAKWAIAIVLLPFAMSIPFGIGQRILVGEGKNHIVALIGIAGPVVATLTTFVLLSLHSDLLVLGMATPVGILLVSIICFFVALKSSQWTLKDFLVRRSSQRKPKLWNAAIPMLIISITVPLAMQSDRLVLSHFSKALELSEYSVAAQMYVPCFSIISMAAVALWPIFSRSGAASSELWAKAFSTLAASGAILAIIFVALVGPVSVLITESKLSVRLDLAVAFGTLLVVMACHQTSAVLLTSPEHLRFQAICSTIMLIANLALSVLLAPLLGASGVVWASVISVSAAQLFPCILKARNFMSTSLEREPVRV